MKFLSLDTIKDTTHFFFTNIKATVINVIDKIYNVMIGTINSIMGESSLTTQLDSMITNGYAEIRHDAKAIINIGEKALGDIANVVYTYDTSDPELFKAELAGKLD